MAKVKFRQEAIDDLSSIWEYTYNEWSENQADEYYHLIKSACSEIGFNPQIGKNTSKLESNYSVLESENILYSTTLFQIKK